jgi:hypothetical protein
VTDEPKSETVSVLPIDPELAALLERLAGKQKTYQRMMRRNILTLVVGIGTITLGYLALVALGGGRWVFRDGLADGCLGMLGLLACWGQVILYRALVTRDGEVLERMRETARMEAVVKEMTPLIRAITDAHAKGVPLLIPPGTVNIAPPQQQETVH